MPFGPIQTCASRYSAPVCRLVWDWQDHSLTNRWIPDHSLGAIYEVFEQNGTQSVIPPPVNLHSLSHTSAHNVCPVVPDYRRLSADS